MSYYNENTIVFLDGEYVKASDAKIDLYSQSLHYGYSVFEGIRSYKTVNDDACIFKAVEHYERLRNSAATTNIPFEYSVEALIDITYKLLAKNNLQDAYIRPLVFLPANMSFSLSKESHLFMAVWVMAPFFGEKLMRVMTSSFQRPNPKGFRIEAKAAGHYVNSMLASQEAKSKGFDEALLTDINGFVAEGTGANVFFEKNGKLVTPPVGNILPGITRATVLEICSDLQIEVEEKLFTTDELKNADAAFFCGTAAEIVGWESFDEVKFPKAWNESIGKVIQLAYKQKVRTPALARVDEVLEKNLSTIEEAEA
jgi:branched-chain amino acid aminotransferase